MPKDTKTCPVCSKPIPTWADICSMACSTIHDLRKIHGENSYGELLIRHLHGVPFDA